MEYLNPKLADLQSCIAVLVVELDPQRPESHGRPPAPLDRPRAEQLARHIAGDLSALYPGLEDMALILSGALYDQTEVLRPGFPLTRTLEDVFRGTLGQGFQPGVIALGTDTGSFPVAALNPARLPGSGPLLLLPCCLIGRRLAVSTLTTNMENSLLDSGTASEATLQTVQEGFGVEVVNLSYATLNDLCALLRVQLENAGVAGLADLLEHGIYRRSGVRRVISEQGQVFLLDDGTLHTPFLTFDDWAQFGPGRERTGGELADGYAAWSQEFRQYGMTLMAYGFDIRVLIGANLAPSGEPETLLAQARAATALAGDYLVETVQAAKRETPERMLEITNQFHPEVGTVAYTVLALDEAGEALSLEHHYPLRPSGLNTIIEQLVHRSDDFAAGRRVLHPWQLVYSPTERCLEPAGEAPEAPIIRH